MHRFFVADGAAFFLVEPDRPADSGSHASERRDADAVNAP
jgi:hypothetical protein